MGSSSGAAGRSKTYTYIYTYTHTKVYTSRRGARTAPGRRSPWLGQRPPPLPWTVWERGVDRLRCGSTRSKRPGLDQGPSREDLCVAARRPQLRKSPQLEVGSPFVLSWVVRVRMHMTQACSFVRSAAGMGRTLIGSGAAACWNGHGRACDSARAPSWDRPNREREKGPPQASRKKGGGRRVNRLMAPHHASAEEGAKKDSNVRSGRSIYDRKLSSRYRNPKQKQKAEARSADRSKPTQINQTDVRFFLSLLCQSTSHRPGASCSLLAPVPLVHTLFMVGVHT